MLTKRFLQTQKQRLLSKKKRVTAGIRELSGKPIDGHARYKINDELPLVDAALERIEAGSYGSCIDCGDPIPEERLKVRPETARCVACQTETEEAKRAEN